MPNTMSDHRIEEMLSGSPFQQALGLELVAADAECVELAMPFNAELERAPGTGQFHGGAISSLIDIAGDFALVKALGFGVPTINFRTDYLRPAFNTSLRARATVRHAGRTVGVVDVDVLDDDGRLVAVGRGTYRTKEG